MSNTTPNDPVPERPHGQESVSKTVEFHFLKSNHYRVVKVDGGVGGVVGSSGIQVNVFSERVPIPVTMVFESGPEHTIGKPLKTVSRQGVVREVEVGLAMTAEVARSLGEYLIARAAECDKHIAAVQGKREAAE